jgi:hypothetical protein
MKQMVQVTCVPGTTLLGTRCYYPCPFGTIALDTDPSYCVADIQCPSETMFQDYINPNVCFKRAVSPINNVCEPGYTKWSSTICYVDCPIYFLENGNTCGKRIATRNSTAPQCDNSWFYDYVNGECQVSFLGVVFVILIVAAVFILLFNMTKSTPQVQKCRRR